MSTINPNQTILGSEKTVADIITTPFPNPISAGRAAAQLKDFQQFMLLQNNLGTDGSTIETTDQPGVYLLTTGDGEVFKVINTDECNLDFSGGPIEPDDKAFPYLVLGGTVPINVVGGHEDNKIMGNLGNNFLQGFAGNDTIGGGAGHDTLHGGDGNDVLIGGSGNDVLQGGKGNDLFAYSTDFVLREGEHDTEKSNAEERNYHYGHDTVSDFGDGDDKLLLGDFNRDGVFDNNDYVVANHQTDEGHTGTLITFLGPDGNSRGSVFLKDVDADKLIFTHHGTTG